MFAGTALFLIGPADAGLAAAAVLPAGVALPVEAVFLTALAYP